MVTVKHKLKPLRATSQDSLASTASFRCVHNKIPHTVKVSEIQSVVVHECGVSVPAGI